MNRLRAARALSPQDQGDMSLTSYVNLALRVEEINRTVSGSFRKLDQEEVDGARFKLEELEKTLLFEIERNKSLLEKIKQSKKLLG